MSVNPPDAATVQASALNESQHFVVFGDLSLRQRLE